MADEPRTGYDPCIVCAATTRMVFVDEEVCAHCGVRLDIDYWPTGQESDLVAFSSALREFGRTLFDELVKALRIERILNWLSR